MEYWEGFFLGKFWTDSDYNDHQHKTLFVGISFLVFLLTALSAFSPDRVKKIFFLPIYLNFIFGIILLIALPFIAHYYYKVNIFLRLSILFSYCLQYIFLFLGFIKIFTGKEGLDIDYFIQYFSDIFDKVMIFSGDVFIFLGGLGSAIASVAGGIFIGALIALLLFGLMIFIPLLYLIFFRFVQRLVDRFVYYTRVKGSI